MFLELPLLACFLSVLIEVDSERFELFVREPKVLANRSIQQSVSIRVTQNCQDSERRFKALRLIEG